VAAQATPILALAPLFALWFGSGLLGKVVICALIVFFPVAVATMVGIRSVDARILELGRSLRATRRQVLTTLEIPAALPNILGGMRVGVTLAVVGAIVGEWAGADRGLGVLINVARGSLFDTPLMFATLLTIALVGIGLYVVVIAIERRLVGAR
jgi:NitT/TauT family transport system permease protein